MKYHKKPFHLQDMKIELTYKCPLACIHCSSDAHIGNVLEIGVNKCKALIDEARKVGVKSIEYSGGEPLLHPSIVEIVKHTSDSGIESAIYTTGCIDDNRILQTLKDKGLSKIVYSIYSVNKTEHENITRIEGSFDKTVNSIKSAIKLKFNVELHFVALKRNYKSLEDVVIYTSQVGVSQISVLRFVPQGRGILLQNDILNKKEYIELKGTIDKLRHKGYNIRTGSPFNFLLLNKTPGCYSGINRLVVVPELTIYPCDAFKKILPEEIVGTSEYSTLDTYSLQECWLKSPFLNKVRDYLTTDFKTPCKECELLEDCLSGCLAQKVLLSGNFDKRPDPSCVKNLILKK